MRLGAKEEDIVRELSLMHGPRHASKRCLYKVRERGTARVTQRSLMCSAAQSVLGTAV